MCYQHLISNATRHVTAISVAVLLFFNGAEPNLLQAQVVTTITPDATLPTNSVIQPNGNIHNITAGTDIGSNLFHSFQDFSVGNGDTANFVASGGTANILSRVTGSNVSNIFGQLRSNSAANLYFLNPNGVVFGPESSLDIGGSFHVSTADFVRLGDGPGLFSASEPANDVLLAASPSAFGFLPGNTAAGSLEIQGILSENPGQTLEVVGGDIIIRNGTLTVPGGDILLTGSNLTITDSGAILSDATDAFNGGNVRINVTGQVLVENDGEISSTSRGSGTAGNVTVQASTIILNEESQIRSDTSGPGAGGNVLLTTDTLLLTGDAEISSDVNMNATGNGGTVTIEAQTITLQDNPEISTDTEQGSSGSGGNLQLIARESIRLVIQPEANEELNDTIEAGIFTNSEGSGDAGGIDITTPLFEIDGGVLTARTEGAGAGGNIEVDIGTLIGQGKTEVTTSSRGGGTAGDVTVQASTIILNEESQIRSDTSGPGAGGNVLLTTDTLLLTGDAEISSDVNMNATGNGGTVTIEAQTITLQDNPEISTDTEQGSSGSGGNLQLIARESIRLVIQPEANEELNDTIEAGIFTNSEGSGDAGGIDITTPLLEIDGGVITARTEGAGAGGDIMLSGQTIALSNMARVSAESTGTGNAGALMVGDATTHTVRLENGIIRTTAQAASGGNIKVNATELIHLINSAIESSVQGDETTSGGNISLDPEFVIVQDSQILAQATQGAGGNIDLIGNTVLVDPFSTIDASSQFGISGSVNIQAPIQNLSGTIAPLPETIIETATLYGARCAAQKGSEFSSLNVRGRDRVPFEPGDYLLTPLRQNNTGTSLSDKTATTEMTYQLGFPVSESDGQPDYEFFISSNLWENREAEKCGS